MSQQRIAISAWVYLVIAGLALIDAFIHLPPLVPVTAGLIVFFILLQFREIPLPQKIAGIVLTLIGLIGAAASENWAAVVIDGIARSRIFLLLFFAVSWLQFPVNQSPSMQAAQRTIVSQPPGRRFLYMSFGVHILGSVLNLAGLGLLSTMVEKQKSPHLRRRMAMALINGFGSAACWSPCCSGMIVGLVAIPTLSWRGIGPVGVILALAIMLMGWTSARLVLRAAMAGRPPHAGRLAQSAAIRTDHGDDAGLSRRPEARARYARRMVGLG